MGWFLVGIVVSGIVFIIVFTLSFRWDISAEAMFGLIFLPFLIASLIALLGNTNNYNEKALVSTQPLIALSDGVSSSGGGLFYVSISANNMFTYYTEVESEYTTENATSYVSRTVPGSLTVIVEEKNNTEPRLLVYEQTGKKSFWYFHVPRTITEYVFYVPEGTIQRNIALN